MTNLINISLHHFNCCYEVVLISINMMGKLKLIKLNTDYNVFLYMLRPHNIKKARKYL